MDKLLTQYIERELNKTKSEKSATPAIFKVPHIEECVNYISSIRSVSDLKILSTYITSTGEDHQGYGYTENCPCLYLACNYYNEGFWRHIRNNISIFGYLTDNMAVSGMRDPRKYVSKQQVLKYIFEESEFKELDEYCKKLRRYLCIGGQQEILTECKWGVQGRGGEPGQDYYVYFNLLDLLILHMNGPDATNDKKTFEEIRLQEEIKECRADLREIRKKLKKKN